MVHSRTLSSAPPMAISGPGLPAACRGSISMARSSLNRCGMLARRRGAPRHAGAGPASPGETGGPRVPGPRRACRRRDAAALRAVEPVDAVRIQDGAVGLRKEWLHADAHAHTQAGAQVESHGNAEAHVQADASGPPSGPAAG